MPRTAFHGHLAPPVITPLYSTTVSRTLRQTLRGEENTALRLGLSAGHPDRSGTKYRVSRMTSLPSVLSVAWIGQERFTLPRLPRAETCFNGHVLRPRGESGQ